jgi:Rieske Fe-S protein
MQSELEEWTRSTFDVESIDFRWSAQDYSTADGVPYVGRSPASRSVHVATGFGKWGLSNGTAAAIMLADLLAGRENDWLPMFDARRVGDVKALARHAMDNVHVGTELVAGHLRARFETAPTTDLRRGEGGLVEVDGNVVGAYRDPGGRLHAVDPTCTHLKCRTRWNAAETSWDCPCHGSRFDIDGTVLNGPAVEPLHRIDVERPGSVRHGRGDAPEP